MIVPFLRRMFPVFSRQDALDAEYEPFRKALAMAGLEEDALRRMDPDDRVAVLEAAQLDPYDYIYLACG